MQLKIPCTHLSIATVIIRNSWGLADFRIRLFATPSNVCGNQLLILLLTKIRIFLFRFNKKWGISMLWLVMQEIFTMKASRDSHNLYRSSLTWSDPPWLVQTNQSHRKHLEAVDQTKMFRNKVGSITPKISYLAGLLSLITYWMDFNFYICFFHQFNFRSVSHYYWHFERMDVDIFIGIAAKRRE